MNLDGGLYCYPSLWPCLRSIAPSVLCRCATPPCRARGSYSSSPSPTVPPLSGCGWQQGLSVLAREVSVHAWGLRLRSACVALALYRASQCCLPVSLTPSAPLILAFSELTISGYPAYTCPYPTLQVRGFPPPSHGLGSGWFATPFLYDSFIHYFTPVYPNAIQASEPAPQSESEEGGDGCELGLEGFLDFENRILQTKSRI